MDVVEYRGDQYQVSRTFLRQIGGRSALYYLLQGVDWANRYSGVIQKVGSTATKVYKAIADKVGEFQVDRQIANEEYRLAKRQKLDEVARNLERQFEAERSGSAFTTQGMSGAIEFKRSYVKVGRKKRRTAKEIFTSTIGNMSEIIFRWQRVSPSLLGPGDVELSYGQKSGATLPAFSLPFHFVSLTQNPLFATNVNFGCYNSAMNRLVYCSSNKAFSHQGLAGQNNTGSYLTTAVWSDESGINRGANAQIDPKGVFHKWSEVRLNLYGSAYYPLKYEILVVTGMPVEMSLFDFAPIATGAIDDFKIFESSNLNAFLRDHCKDYIGNPIVGSNHDRTDYKSKFRIIRRKVVHIDPLSYGDGAIQSGTTGPVGIDASNVRNVNMFIRHDRFRDYSWTNLSSDQTIQPNLDGVGFDKTDISSTSGNSGLSDVDREERVYLFIKCSAPRLMTGDGYGVTTPVAPTSLPDNNVIPPFTGTYDCVVRNCFRYEPLAET